MNNLFLDFPVLRKDGMDFDGGVEYCPTARIVGGEVEIEHRLTGSSFIRDMLEKGEAKFCAALLYRISGEREHYIGGVSKKEGEKEDFVIVQKIPQSYARANPELMPCIISIVKKTINAADPSSGLSGFWNEEINFPKSARIAIGQKIIFTSGGLRSLMKIEHEKSMNLGTFEVSVEFSAGVGEVPVTLLCAKDVFDALKQTEERIMGLSPKNYDSQVALGRAMATQALCSFYSKMRARYKEEPDYQAPAAIRAHLEELKEKNSDNGGWEDDDFKPDLAATRMLAYVFSSMREEEDDND